MLRGNGNNGSDKTEGARTENAIGTYMHGPVLPNNPKLADSLIRLALECRGVKSTLQPVNDTLAMLCRKLAKTRKY